MSTNQNPHPARSPEFLSRLHDQELSPGERAHFESHRAHCAECRTAAAQFEEALALFRASTPRPASPDLAARILRKLQASGGRRRPFGVTFGIDMRWAGALAAALVAAIVGTSIVMKNEAREAQSRLTRGPVPVVMESDNAKAPPASNAPAPGAPAPPARSSRGSELRGGAKDEAPAIADKFAGAPEEKQKEASKKQLDRSYAQAPPPAAAANVAQAPAEERQEAADQATAAPSRERAQEGKLEKPAPQAARAKSAAATRPDVQDRRQRLDGFAAQSTQRDQERPGGEGGTLAASEEAAARPVRLVVTAADGAGPAPELIPSPTVELPADLRGREFVVIVDAAGRVRQVLPRHPALRDSRANENRLAKTQAASPLSALRFQPGDRQRRLLVRAE